MNIVEMLIKAVELNASDLHITVNLPPMMRINGILRPYGNEILRGEDTREAANTILSESQMNRFEEDGEIDTSYVISDLSRFRVNVFRQRGSIAIAIRLIRINIPTMSDLGFPDVLKEIVLKPRGIVLVTGPTGSGKSTTLAAMVDHVNRNRSCHIITLEDPIEYLHKHNKSMINQREIGSDSQSFGNALRASLREDPDVILVGEMRDLDTISTAVTAAETGHLVLSTLHTTGAAQSIERIIDVFPPHQQQQIKVQLASVLEAIISQQLLTSSDGSRMVAALEILIANNAIKNLIREGKGHQIQTQIQTNLKQGMKTMDYALAELVKSNYITFEDALGRCVDPDMLRKYVGLYY